MFVNNNGGTISAASGTLNLTDNTASTNGNFDAQTPAVLNFDGTVTGTYQGVGTGAVGLCGNIMIVGAAGAAFDFAAGLFQWSNSGIDLDGDTLTNTGAISISVNGGNVYGTTGISSGTGNQGGTLDNQGTITQPSGYFYLDDSVTIKNEGTYDLTGNASIDYGNNSPSIVNTSTGLFEQTGGANTSSIGVFFNNNGGTVDAATGFLNLSGGTSSSNGNFNAQTPGTVGLGGSVSGAYFGSGTGAVGLTGTSNSDIIVAAAGATFDFAPGLFQWTQQSIDLDGNTLTNTGTMSISGTAYYNTIYGNTVVGGSASTGNQGGTLDNQGTILQASGYYYLYDNVAIQNEGTYDLTGDAAFYYGNTNNASMTNTSTGLVEKTGGPSTSTIGILFNNNGGTVNAATGFLNLSGGTSSSNGNFNAQAPGTIGLGGSVSGIYLGSGTGAVGLTGTTNNDIIVAAAGATFNFAPGLFQWTRQSIDLDGNTLTNTGTMSISGTAYYNTIYGNTVVGGSASTGNQGGTLDNQGTILQASGYYYLYDNVAIQNQGTYGFTGDADFYYGNTNNASMTNTSTGLVEKTGGTGTSTVGILFNNDGGTANATSGTLSLAGGGDSTNGNFNAQAPGAVGLGGPVTGIFLGSGSGAVGLTGNIIVGAGGATFDFAPGLFQWTSQSIDLDGNTLTNTGSMSISGTAYYNTVFGNTQVAGNGTGNQGGTWDNQGTILQASGYFELQDSVTIKNEGTYDFTGDADIDLGDNTSPSMVNTSTGTVEKTGGSGTSSVNVSFVNQGTLNGQTGTLFLADGDANTGGAYDAEGSGSVDLGGAITGTFTGSGTGTVGLGGNVLIGAAGATFDFPAGLFQWTSNAFDLDGNTLTNAGSITITRTAYYNTFFGNTQVNGGGTGGQGGTLDNQGTIVQASAYYELGDNVTIENEGTYDFTSDADIYLADNSSPSIVNTSTGVVEKTSGTATSTIGVAFNNNGTVDIERGNITFNSVVQVNGTKLTGGAWIVAGTGSLSLPGGSLTENDGSVTLSGAGTFSQIDAAANNVGNFSLLGSRRFHDDRRPAKFRHDHHRPRQRLERRREPYARLDQRSHVADRRHTGQRPIRTVHGEWRRCAGRDIEPSAHQWIRAALGPNVSARRLWLELRGLHVDPGVDGQRHSDILRRRASVAGFDLAGRCRRPRADFDLDAAVGPGRTTADDQLSSGQSPGHCHAGQFLDRFDLFVGRRRDRCGQRLAGDGRAHRRGRRRWLVHGDPDGAGAGGAARRGFDRGGSGQRRAGARFKSGEQRARVHGRHRGHLSSGFPRGAGLGKSRGGAGSVLSARCAHRRRCDADRGAAPGRRRGRLRE